MSDELEELRKEVLLKIPEGATPEQFKEIMAKKIAGGERLQTKLQQDQSRFGNFMKWSDRINYVWMSVLVVLLLFAIIGALGQGGSAALNLWSGSTRIVALLLLSGIYALRGRLRSK